MNLSRKDVAARTGYSVRTIKRHEEKLGLAAIRVKVTGRVVYPERKALHALRARGLEA